MDLEGYDVGSKKNEISVQPSSKTTTNPKVLRAIKNLGASSNPEASKIVTEAKSGNDSLPMTESRAMTLSEVIEFFDQDLLKKLETTPIQSNA